MKQKVKQKTCSVLIRETYNDQELAEAHAAGLHDVNRLGDRWDRDLTVQEMETEIENVVVFDKSCGNPIMNLLRYISENYEGDERTNIEKDGEYIVNSYRPPLVAHNSSGFDCWVFLNSLVKEITDLKSIKIARGLISLSFRCGVKIVNSVEGHQYEKFTCTKPHIKRSSEKIGKEYSLESEHLKGEIEHSVKNKCTCAGLSLIWDPYLCLDMFCLAFIYARHSMEMQKLSGFGIKDCLTEASIGWNCFGTYDKNREF